jgi:hypothetical protein
VYTIAKNFRTGLKSWLELFFHLREDRLQVALGRRLLLLQQGINPEAEGLALRPGVGRVVGLLVAVGLRLRLDAETGREAQSRGVGGERKGQRRRIRGIVGRRHGAGGRRGPWIRRGGQVRRVGRNG